MLLKPKNKLAFYELGVNTILLELQMFKTG